jgi:hypothetical protein
MPRSQLTKIDILSRVIKMKNELHDGSYSPELPAPQKKAVDEALSKVVDIINEYRY